MVLSVLFLILQLGFIIFLLYMCIAFVSGAPFVPTKRSSAEAMIRLANLKKGTKVYDLGSGNGKLLRLAQAKGARAVGFEINPLLVMLSNLRGARTRWKNFWNADISDADVVLVYLLPTHMERLKRKLKKEVKKGTLVVSNSFIFPGWKILRQDSVNHIYVFSV
ncbi:MAG: hypothetical protein UY49_C0005G0012 [Microgenomates group bacterium GW2011_GWC1_49_7]|nr:MAG: hypothetical protein UY49_C0005G0012 [Microgenomates group bacterium GW2011_GWC1_49_7]